MQRIAFITLAFLFAVAQVAATVSIHESSVRSCLGPGQLYAYETSDPYETSATTQFTPKYDRLLIFTRWTTGDDFWLSQDSTSIPFVLIDEDDDLAVRIYEANVTPNVLLDFLSVRDIGDHQGFLSYDSNKGFYDGDLRAIHNEADSYTAYLTERTYSFLFFDKYTVHRSDALDDRLVTIDIEGNDYEYKAPFPQGVEGLIRHHQQIPNDGYYTITIESEDSIYYYPLGCEEPAVCEEELYCTQSQGGWGAPCNGNNPGCMRDIHWPQVIGENLTIGTGYTMTFTGPSAIEDYLPGGGPAAVLTEDHIDPTTLIGGSLGAQLTALQLNILFAEAGVGLAGESSYLTDHLISEGPFEGMSVGDFRDLAFEVFGATTSLPDGTSLSDFSSTADAINNNYVDCTVDEGYLIPICEPPEEPKGSITVCKRIVDEDGYAVVGDVGTNFTISSSFGVATFETPLAYHGPVDNATCLTYDDLDLGVYSYDEEIIESDLAWDTPLYNDEYPSGSFSTYANGSIELTKNNPHRTLIVLNRLESEDEPKGSITVCKRIVDADGLAVVGGPGTNFTIPAGFGDSVFTTPLVYDSPVGNASCVTYDDLDLGVYSYDEEIIESDLTWKEPLYNDNYPTGSFEVYDNGSFELTYGTPNRVLLVVNELEEEPTGSITICKRILGTDGSVISGAEGWTFTIPSENFSDAIFESPLSYPACTIYEGLAFGSYSFSDEIIDSDVEWKDPIYELDSKPVLMPLVIELDDENPNRELRVTNLLEKEQICELPSINHSYTGPVYENVSVWLDTASRIVIELEGELSQVCDEETLEYSDTIVDDEYCIVSELCAGSEYDPEWVAYNDPISLSGEGCHLIDYRVRSGELENTGRVCVFYDATPPVLEKHVAEPKTPFNGMNPFYPEAEDVCESADCYTITKQTPITMSCTEDGAEQSGVAQLCYEIGFNGADVTEAYCDGTIENGLCCIAADTHTLSFTNESWHKLSFTCTDNVNKTADVRTQYYKVDGWSFTITINKKWNLISTPVSLHENALEELFAEHEDRVATIWAYKNGNWYVYSPSNPPAANSLTTMVPGWGYWLLATEDFNLTIGGSLLEPAVSPPSKTISNGWNLIGYYGTEGLDSYDGPVGAGKQVQCALDTIRSDALQNLAPSLWTYWEPDNPNQWHALDQWDDHMDPGAGYWLYSPSSGAYAPSTC